MLKRMLGICSCLILAISLSGCALLFGAAAGAGGTAYWLSGKLSSEVAANYDTAVNSAKLGLADLKMEVKKETRTDDVTQIISEYSDGREVWVDVRPLGSEKAKIEIRVGMRGDKAASSKIMDQIKKHL